MVSQQHLLSLPVKFYPFLALCNLRTPHAPAQVLCPSKNIIYFYLYAITISHLFVIFAVLGAPSEQIVMEHVSLLLNAPKRAEQLRVHALEGK